MLGLKQEGLEYVTNLNLSAVGVDKERLAKSNPMKYEQAKNIAVIAYNLAKDEGFGGKYLDLLTCAALLHTYKGYQLLEAYQQKEITDIIYSAAKEVENRANFYPKTQMH